MDTLKGFVEHIIYKNPQNGYGVINLTVGFLRTLMKGSA